MKSKIQTIRLPQALFNAVVARVEADRTTVADFIRRAVAETVEQRDKTAEILSAISAGRDAILSRLAELEVTES